MSGHIGLLWAVKSVSDGGLKILCGFSCIQAFLIQVFNVKFE